MVVRTLVSESLVMLRYPIEAPPIQLGRIRVNTTRWACLILLAIQTTISGAEDQQRAKEKTSPDYEQQTRTGQTQDVTTNDAQPRPGPQSTTSAGTPGKAKSKKTGDIFTPSEEISEDFAVSFPVDI